MESVTYDAAILQRFADELYRRAKWIAYDMAFRYGIVAFAVTALVMSAVQTSSRTQSPDPFGTGVVAALILATVGAAVGRSKAFMLKVEAQKILCQRQVELNTRPNAQARAAAAQ